VQHLRLASAAAPDQRTHLGSGTVGELDQLLEQFIAPHQRPLVAGLLPAPRAQEVLVRLQPRPRQRYAKETFAQEREVPVHKRHRLSQRQLVVHDLGQLVAVPQFPPAVLAQGGAGVGARGPGKEDLRGAHLHRGSADRLLDFLGAELLDALALDAGNHIAVALHDDVEAVLLVSGLTRPIRLRPGIERLGERDGKILELERLQVLERKLGKPCASRRRTALNADWPDVRRQVQHLRDHLLRLVARLGHPLFPAADRALAHPGMHRQFPLSPPARLPGNAHCLTELA
jgi:hypothetical protein